MYEHHSEQFLSRKKFLIRFFVHFLVALLLLLFSLGIGIFGYHVTEGFSLIDSLLNASMILGGMGPVNEMKTTAGKLFASFYSLFSGIIFLAIAGIIVAPVAHRILHKLHLSSDESE